MITVRLLLLTCCVALCTADGWNWTCQQVAEEKNVNIDKLLGRWYYVEWIVPGKIKHDHYCRVLNISRTGNNSVLLFQYNETEPNGGHKISNVETILVSASKWMAGDTSQKVVDLAPDGRTLAVGYCNPNENLVVFSRRGHLDLGPLHDRLRSAGVLGVEHAEPFDRTGCPVERSQAIKKEPNAATYGWGDSGLYTSLMLLVLSRLL